MPFALKLAVCVSSVSTSLKPTAPPCVCVTVFSPVALSVISVTAPLCTPEVMTGASLVPVITIVTVCVAVPPWPSSTVTS
ncbi:hypothetical protein D3C71_1871450 [compost metagenome]